MKLFMILHPIFHFLFEIEENRQVDHSDSIHFLNLHAKQNHKLGYFKDLHAGFDI